MDDRFESLACMRISEDMLAHGPAIKRAIRAKHIAAEGGNYFREACCADRDDLSRDQIRIDDLDATRGEAAFDFRLARSDTAGQCDGEHVRPSPGSDVAMTIDLITQGKRCFACRIGEIFIVASVEDGPRRADQQAAAVA